MGAAQDFHVPDSAVAGEEASISTQGSGKAIFYLVGPGVSRRNDVTLGQEVPLAPEDLRNAGDYLAILCSGTCHSASFYVGAAKPASLTFLVHPSRVPVAQGDAVSGVAFPFDQYHNLVLSPESVSFQLAAKDAPCGRDRCARRTQWRGSAPPPVSLPAPCRSRHRLTI
jgi:hypothetical protein